jgi:hypothetical protein
MTAQAPAKAAPKGDGIVEQKVQKLRELYADAPELGKVALENMISDMEKGPGDLKKELEGATGLQTAGRVGARQGRVSELTLIAPIAKGAAKRLRGVLQVLEGNFKGADRVGTLHDMRFVFLDNDTKLLFATAYDDEWDPYIDDFATKIPNEMDMIFSNMEGWPGIRSAAVKDWIVKYQVPADAWYVASPNLTVSETRRLERVGHALDEFLDKVG